MSTTTSVCAAITERLKRLGIDPRELRIEQRHNHVTVMVTFATPDDLARYAAEDRAKVEVADRRIPLRHIEHSAMYDRDDVQVLLLARVWEWELSDEAVTA